MNILRIRYFIDVANLKSFTKAAKQNFVSQTAVSQQIGAIERELEVQLFSRDRGVVNLTRAGESFYNDCVRIIGLYDKAVERAKNISQSNHQTITLGVITGSKNSYINEIIHKLNESCRSINVKPIQSSFAEQRDLMKSGEFDAAITLKQAFGGVENYCNIDALCRDRMGLLVSLKNPLARYDEINARDIENEPIVMVSQEFGGEIYNHMIEMRKKEGYFPYIVETVDSQEMLTMMVEINRGSAFLPERMTRYNKKFCKMLHIKDNDDYVDYVIAWQKSGSKEVQALVECCQCFFENDFQQWLIEN